MTEKKIVNGRAHLSTTCKCGECKFDNEVKSCSEVSDSLCYCTECPRDFDDEDGVCKLYVNHIKPTDGDESGPVDVVDCEDTNCADCPAHGDACPYGEGDECDCDAEQGEHCSSCATLGESIALLGLEKIIIEPIHHEMMDVYFEGNTGNKFQCGTELLKDEEYLPKYASEGDSGMDVRALKNIVIQPGESVHIPLGFKMEIPQHPLHDLGYRYECQCRPRSGMSAKTFLRVSNAPGTIDNFYTGEVGVLLTNTRPDISFIGELIHSLIYVVEDLVGKVGLNVGVWEKVRSAISKYRSRFPEFTGTDGKQIASGVAYEIINDGKLYENGSYLIRKGDRIAQLVFTEVIRPMEFVIGKVESKRDGGFGSTGK